MTVRLTIENIASLASGDPIVKQLDGHGLVIGRANHVDWTLPDPQATISSVHCEIDYRDGEYWLTDRSTNGTYANGSGTRLDAPWRISDGDLFAIGNYTVRASVEATRAGAGGFGAASSTAPASNINVWGAPLGDKPDQSAQTDAFGQPKRKAIFSSGDRHVEENFRQPEAIVRAADPFGLGSGGGASASFAAQPGNDPFGLPAPSPASAGGDPFGLGGASTTPAWSPDPSPPPSPIAYDGGETAAPWSASPTPAPWSASPTPTPWSASPAPPELPASTGGASIWSTLTEQPPIDFATPSPPTPAAAALLPGAAIPPPASLPPQAHPAARDSALFARFLAGAGIQPHDVADVPPENVLAAAGELLRQTADGLIRLLYARARLRNQFGVGAEVTTFQRAGNNPLKWTKSAGEALRQIVGKPDPGFLPGPQAVRGAFEDLQAHELALMAAMQEALKDTIQRFSPAAIRARPGRSGLLERLLPKARDAALWEAYEAEYNALADETESAYLDVFAKNFKKAYSRNLARVDDRPK